jgi:hypothetical protein
MAPTTLLDGSASHEDAATGDDRRLQGLVDVVDPDGALESGCGAGECSTAQISS